MNTQHLFIPTVLSGGSGTRLWPLSRTKLPKQFCEIFEESLFKMTLKRLLPLGSPYVVTNQSMKVLTELTTAELKIPHSQIIYEPKANNTAPAIALLCRILELQNKSQAIVGVFPSDQLIQNETSFQNAVELATLSAEQGQIVTLGIKPTYPATGYGYIEVDSKILLNQGPLNVRTTKGFREKPSEDTAEGFIQAGNFFWNAGMFIFKVSTLIEAFKTHLPELWAAMAELKVDQSNLNEIYAKTPNISIDYGIMEKAKNQTCIPVDLNWSDVGSWDEIAKVFPSSPSVEVEAKDNYVFSKTDRNISMVNVSDLIVVDTPDALLITKKGSSQNIKKVVEKLIQENNLKAHEHPYEFRPWGKFEILRDTDFFKSKVIQVNPGQQLSYQSHSKRAEHWVIIKGHPEVTLNDKIHTLNPGESIYIPLEAKHRIKNPSKNELVEFVEVQVGTYFGEDDIVRYQDDYKRV